MIASCSSVNVCIVLFVFRLVTAPCPVAESLSFCTERYVEPNTCILLYYTDKRTIPIARTLSRVDHEILARIRSALLFFVRARVRQADLCGAKEKKR